jgi:hypothetical protein
MPPRTRKGTTEPAGRPAKLVRAKKATDTTSQPPPAQAGESGHGNRAAEAASAGTAADAPVDTESAPTADLSSRVLSQDTSEESSSSTHVEPDGTLIESRTVRSTCTRREYEPGHIVEETVTVTNERTERVPVPYAGPVAEHPAPVG